MSLPKFIGLGELGSLAPKTLICMVQNVISTSLIVLLQRKASFNEGTPIIFFLYLAFEEASWFEPCYIQHASRRVEDPGPISD